jgi:hypothetical protein
MRRFVVQDNGEGPHGSPNLISTIPANPTGQKCEDSTPEPAREVRDGNVQVR